MEGGAETTPNGPSSDLELDESRRESSRPTRRQRRSLARRRFGTKLLTTFAVTLTLVTTVAFGVAGLFMHQTNERVLEGESTRHLESVARLAAREFSQRPEVLFRRAAHPNPIVSRGPRHDLRAACRALRGEAQVSEIAVFLVTGAAEGADVVVLGSSSGENEPAILGRLLADADLAIAEAIESQRPASSSIWGDELPDQEFRFYKSAYMPVGVSVDGARVLVGVELPAEYAKAVSEVDNTFVALGILAGLTVLAAAIILVKQRVEVPVYRLWRSMQGERPGRVRVRYPDEIGVLTEHYNSMVDRLEDKDLKLNQLYDEAREKASYLTAYSNSLVGGVPEGVVAVDTKGQLTVWNASAQRILCESVPLGAQLPNPEAPLSQALRRALDGSSTDKAMIILTVPGEGEPEDPDRQRLVELTCAPFRDESGALLGAVALVNDRTELETFRRVAERNQRLAAIGSLGGGLAHEIKNPLGAILGFAELIERGGDTQRFARRLRDEVTQLDTFLNEFLSFARDNQIRREPTDLADLIRRSVVQALNAVGLDPESAQAAVEPGAPPTQLTLNGGINVRLEVDDLPPLALDGTLLRSAFVNLATNALQAMIEASQASTKGGELLVRAHEVGQSVYVRFRDSGPGIPLESREKIFDPLFTTRAEGTGLGLAITNKTVTAHGGKLSIRDAPGGGAEFVIRLPMVAAPSSGPIPAPNTREEAKQSG